MPTPFLRLASLCRYLLIVTTCTIGIAAEAADCPLTVITNVGAGSCSVPAGVTSLGVIVNGGGGSGGVGGSAAATGGSGSQVTDTISVTPGTTINYFVAGGGQVSGSGGSGGGGAGFQAGGGGGGASYVSLGSNNPAIIAGGGGGANYCNGGNGGNPAGATGVGGVAIFCNGNNGNGGGGSSGVGGSAGSDGNGTDGSPGGSSLTGVSSGGDGGGLAGGAGGGAGYGGGGGGSGHGAGSGGGGGSLGSGSATYSLANNGGGSTSDGGNGSITFSFTGATQSISFTSTAPTTAVVGGSTYTVTATGGGSGNAVTFTIDSSASSVCSISGSTVSFTGAGSCVVNANQASSSNYNAATQAQQSFSVGSVRTFTGSAPVGGAQSVSFTSTDAGCTFDTSTTTFNAAIPGTVDAGFNHVGGINTLRIAGCSTTIPATVNLTITYPTIPAGAVYRKFNPNNSTWFNFGTVSGNVVTFSITDGQQGDDDATVNGIILDPGTLSTASASGNLGIPTLTEWGQLILGALLAIGGVGFIRRRRVQA